MKEKPPGSSRAAIISSLLGQALGEQPEGYILGYAKQPAPEVQELSKN